MNPASVKASYRHALKDMVTVRRYVGSGTNRPRFDVENVHANVTGFAPHELVGGIVQGDRQILILVEDLIKAKFSLPLTINDKTVVAGRELANIAVDADSKQVDGVLIAYIVQARG